jgi:hypothetical protein
MVGSVRLRLHLAAEDGDPLPPWPGEEFEFDLELALWPHRPPGRRGYASAGEPAEPGGWELRKAECRAIGALDGALAQFSAEAASVCSRWLWAEHGEPELWRLIDAALEHQRAAASCDA